jgi:hypothetical protein
MPSNWPGLPESKEPPIVGASEARAVRSERVDRDATLSPTDIICLAYWYSPRYDCCVPSRRSPTLSESTAKGN